MMVKGASPERLFKILGDATRLRVIRALMEASLTVGELQSTLELPQSTISRHLGAMRSGDVVADRREGACVWYSLSDRLLLDEALMQVLEEAMANLDHAERDKKRLDSALNARREQTRAFFDSIAGTYTGIAKPGGGYEGLVSMMMLGLAPATVVDMGCGEGEIALPLARLGHRVLAVDSSPRMLQTFRKRLDQEGIEGVTLYEGDVEALPLEDDCGSLVLLSQILHHAPRPEAALAEAARVCAPGGRVVVLDLLRHDHEWTREKLGDLWFGFEPGTLRDWMASLGLEGIHQEIVQVENGLPLVAIGGRRPGTN